MWGDRTDVMGSDGVRSCPRCEAIAVAAGTDDWDVREDSPARHSVLAGGRTLAFLYYNGTDRGGWQVHGVGKIHYTAMLAAEVVYGARRSEG